MRRIKLIGLAIVAVVALSTIASASAEELPEFLPGTAGSTFTGTGGKGTLTMAGGTVTCGKDTVLSGVLTTHNLGTADRHVNECSAFGIFGAHTLEDSESIILMKLGLHLCYINKTKKEVGVLTEVTTKDDNEKGAPLTAGYHVEVVGKLIVIKGDQVGQITPVNTSTTAYTIVYKNPAVQCEGLTEHLLAAENGGEFKEATWARTESVTFATAQMLMA